jgi:hypothetical protein
MSKFTKYVKTCKMNLSFAILNLSCFNKNIYLHTNPSPTDHILLIKLDIHLFFLFDYILSLMLTRYENTIENDLW